MKTGKEFLFENISQTNIPESFYENEIGEMMDWYAAESKKEFLNEFLDYLDNLTKQEYDEESLTQHGKNWLKLNK